MLKWVFFSSHILETLYILYFILSCKLEIFFPPVCPLSLDFTYCMPFFPPNESLFLCSQLYLHFLNRL